MILLDSSGWIEMLAAGPRAQVFRAAMSQHEVVVPTIVLYEVYKWMQREVTRELARDAAMEMQQHLVADLDPATALSAATISLEHGLAMADAIVYATAQVHRATLVTGDVDFRELPGVEFIPLDDA